MPKDTEDTQKEIRDGQQSSATTVTDKTQPALQVVCLGSSGGPGEDNVTGFLVRGLSSGWSKGSLLAVDAGSHLAAITRILERSFPLYSASTDTDRNDYTILDDGPFAGVKFYNKSARANALHLLHTYVSCYLITHPHLDHLSGFAINTAAFHGSSKPKTLAALPDTVDAVKRHIFNDVIWPNLSDEDGGVGFVTFQRLKEGGDSMIGKGDSRGYIGVCDGLAVRAFTISHGNCTTGPALARRGSVSNAFDLATTMYSEQPVSRALSAADHAATPDILGSRRASIYQSHAHANASSVVDSTAYFIRDEDTAREVLIFGDVEPDSVSSAPRNEHVWAEAAPRVVSNVLRGMLIECSYSDAVADDTLFGHLCPRHLIAELEVLADMVHRLKTDGHASTRKRKRSGPNGVETPRFVDERRKHSRSEAARNDSSRRTSGSTDGGRHYDNVRFPQELDALSPRALAPRSVSAVHSTSLQPYHNFDAGVTWEDLPLKGLTVVIVHVKDTFTDGPPISKTILAQLEQHETNLRGKGRGLGCNFVISESGESYWF